MDLDRSEAPEWLTPAQTSAALNIDVRTLRRWVKRGYLPRVQLPNGHHRFHRPDVEALLESKAS